MCGKDVRVQAVGFRARLGFDILCMPVDILSSGKEMIPHLRRMPYRSSAQSPDTHRQSAYPCFNPESCSSSSALSV